jgi:hypothetical protein
MATVTKDFRVKHGLVVEGTNATVDGSDIITGDIITGGAQTNIVVTYNPATKALDFEAENGVSDSTTDDLDEGEANLYFTNQRAIDAVGGSATPDNDPNTVVKRDANGDFAAGVITADLTGDVTGQVSDISNHSTTGLVEGANLYFTDTRAVDAVETAATSTNTANKIVQRDENGDFAAGTVTATTFVGNVKATASGSTNYDVISNAPSVGGLGGGPKVKAEAYDIGSEVLAEGGGATGATVYAGRYSSNTETVILGNDSGTKPVYLQSNTSSDNLVATHGHIDSLIGDATVDGTSGNTVTDRIATAVSDLVDSAPELLDTLNELAAAIGDDASFATTIGTEIGTKVSKAGDTMTGALAMGTNKITDLGAPTNDNDAATKKYADDTFVTLEDLPGELDDYVPLTQRAAADGVATLDGAAQVPLTQLENVTDIIDALTTEEIAEGTKLYFTDVRAVDALEAVVPNFTAVEVNSIAKQVAAIVGVEVAAQTVAYAFPKADYRSAKFLVKVSYGNHTEVSEVLLTLDFSDNIAITEFAVVSTNGSASAISAGINGSNVELLVTPTNEASTITVFGTLISSEAVLFA